MDVFLTLTPLSTLISDIVMLPIEIVSAPDLFLFGARERYDIWKFETEKLMGGDDIEHGLNLDPGQL